MANIMNILSNVFAANNRSTAVAPISTKSISANPFEKNPFVSYNGQRFSSVTYAKNNPVKGGYFAGYYNGKQNIVGQRLFVEV